MSQKISLTKGYVAIVDDIDGDLALTKWCVKIGHSTEYAMRKIYADNKRINQFIHREVLSRILGRELQSNEYVDHIDRNGLNNSRINLRLATRSQNQMNRGLSLRNTTGYKGVSRMGKPDRFCAQIMVRGKRIRLGVFVTAEEAHKAYRVAAIEYHGDFARFE